MTLNEELKKAYSLQNKRWNTLTISEKELVQKYSKELKELRKELKKEKKQKRDDRRIIFSQKEFIRMKKKIINTNALFSLDLEFHEYTKEIIEVGICIYNNIDKTIETKHFIVKETLHKRNGKFVPDYKENFQFGKSEILSLSEIEKRTYELFHNNDISYFVGSSFKEDKPFLNQCGIFSDIEVLDTITLSKIYYSTKERIGLERLTKKLNFNANYLHNAGNDAYWTLKCCLKMFF